MTTTTDAQAWLERWDRQQEQYVADREERFAVIGDVLAATLERPDPLIVDLGCGPGSLSVRLLDRFPGAAVIGVDADPLLLGLATAAYGHRDGLRLVSTDLRDDGWVEDLRLPRSPDAVVSTTALHWLTSTELGAVFARCAELLAPGGLLVDGDHLFDAPARPRLDVVTRAVGDARAARVGVAAAEDWEGWWASVGDAAELGELVSERGARPIDHAVEETPSVEDYLRLLGDAGFAEAGTVWQHGDDRVLVALR